MTGFGWALFGICLAVCLCVAFGYAIVLRKFNNGATVLALVLGGLLTLLVVAFLTRPATESERYITDKRRLQQLALATIDFENAHQTFPPLSGRPTKKGVVGAGLSWRVHLLPFLEQQELYEQFRMDEPWDSQHNLTLLEKMPEEFASGWPTATIPPGHTLYLRPAGEDTVASENGARFGYGQITDGSHNTILMVQKSVWGQPRSLTPAFLTLQIKKTSEPFFGDCLWFSDTFFRGPC